jgi:hypothetical protein
LAITKTRKNYKPGDIVLVSSPAGDVIPKVHVKLKKRIIVKERKGRLVGFKKSMDWPGYSGWEATLVYQDEIDVLRKRWSIPYTTPGKDITFVYDYNIIKKSKRNDSNHKQLTKKRNNNKKEKRYVKKIN